MSDFVSQKERDQRIRAEQYQSAVDDGIQRVYQTFPQIKPCIASRQMIITVCQDWVGVDGMNDVVPTPELLRTILFDNPGLMKSLGLEDVRDQRLDIIEQITELLRGTRVDVKALVANTLQWKSRDELIAYRDGIAEKQRLAKVPVAELKQQIREATKVERRADGMPRMPATMVLPAGLKYQGMVSDGIRAWTITADLLSAFLRSPRDSGEYHYFTYHLKRAYGLNQIQERINGN